MSNETARAKMFGPTPGAVRQLRNQEREQAATAAAQLKPFAGAVKAASMAGSAFGDVLGAAMGMQDPAMQQALQMEEVKREVMNLGLDFNDPAQRKDYFKAVQDGFARRGMFDHAENARQMQISEEMAERQMLVNETEASARAVTADASRINALADKESQNVKQYQLPDGTVVEAKAGSDEAKKLLSPEVGGKPYEPRSDLDRIGEMILKHQLEAATTSEEAARREVELFRQQGERAALEASAPVMAHYQQRSITARSMRSAAGEIINVVESGRTTPGALIGMRTSLARLSSLFFGPGAEDIFEALEVNPTDIDIINKAHSYMTAAMADEFTSDSRLGKAVVDLFREGAGDPTMTPEGLWVTSKIMDAKAQRDLKIQNELAELQNPDLPPEQRSKNLISFAWHAARLERENPIENFLDINAIKDQATIAVAKGKIPYAPLDTEDLKKGDLRRHPRTGEVHKWTGTGWKAEPENVR
jgi:hypothetical protein